MDFDPTPFNLTTCLLLILTVGLAIFRFASRLDSNWPVVYYVLLVLYAKGFNGSLDSRWLYAAVITALFLRFEFMGGWVIRIFRVVELVILGHIFWRGLGLVMRW